MPNIVAFLRARVTEGATPVDAVVEKIMTQVLAYEQTIDSEWGCCHYADEIAAGECRYTRPDDVHALRLLASLYAEHPDYRQVWVPEPED